MSSESLRFATCLLAAFAVHVALLSLSVRAPRVQTQRPAIVFRLDASVREPAAPTRTHSSPPSAARQPAERTSPPAVVDAPKAETLRPAKPMAAPALRSTRRARASAAEAPHEAKSDRAVALSEPPAERQAVAPAADPAELRSDRAEEIAARARASYEQVLAAWLERHKRYPLLARRRGSQGTTAIRIRIGRDGRVLASEIERSSEQSILDEAALSMVRQADPFPSMPADLPGTRFEFVAPIRFRVE